MQPNSDQQRGLQVPSSRGNVTPPTSRDAAVRLMRDQIDKIYDDPQPNEQIVVSSVPVEPVQQPQTVAHSAVETTEPSETEIPDSSVYAHTHDASADIAAAEHDEATQKYWHTYHSAWQQYYQQYYGRYYQSQVELHKQQVTTQATTPNETSQSAATANQPPELTEDQAVDELRSELMTKVKNRAEKVKKSRHFRPVLVAIAVMLGALVLQYNQIIAANVMAFTVPTSIEKSDSFTSPTAEVAVGPEPRLVIPAINKTAPVDFTLDTLHEPVVQTRLKKGVVHYPIPGANAMPGQVGNTVILGHSSNDVFDDGEYKFVFLHLERLKKGDKFYIDYQSKRYTYLVSETKVINPDQISELVIDNGKPMATLITCTPIGTSQQRLLVIGEQVSPSPAGATSATEKPTVEANVPPTEIGGGTQGFFQRLFQN